MKHQEMVKSKKSTKSLHPYIYCMFPESCVLHMLSCLLSGYTLYTLYTHLVFYPTCVVYVYSKTSHNVTHVLLSVWDPQKFKFRNVKLCPTWYLKMSIFVEEANCFKINSFLVKIYFIFIKAVSWAQGCFRPSKRYRYTL